MATTKEIIKWHLNNGFCKIRHKKTKEFYSPHRCEYWRWTTDISESDTWTFADRPEYYISQYHTPEDLEIVSFKIAAIEEPIYSGILHHYKSQPTHNSAEYFVS